MRRPATTITEVLARLDEIIDDPPPQTNPPLALAVGGRYGEW